MGPSARAGKNVSPATMTATPTTRPPNSGVSVGKVPTVAGTWRLRPSRPANASVGMMRKKRPNSVAMPSVVLYHWVLPVRPPKAEPLLLAVEAKP